LTGRTLDINDLFAGSEDQLARQIGYKYVEWDQYRRPWLVEKQEIRNYLFATDTRKTTNSKLPWKNSTTIPKLTQIRDNLHANYMSALFPNSNWLHWEGSELDDETKQKSDAIEGYMRTKFRQDRSENEIEKILLDYIDYGNCFATAVWADDSRKLPDGTTQRGYVGPRYVRISPLDIVFNPAAPTFAESPKIIRRLSTLGDLAFEAEKWGKDSDEYKTYNAAIEKSLSIRRQVRSMNQGDTFKTEAFQIDGFGSFQTYLQNDYVELLTFYGDIYDLYQEKLLTNQIIQIIDRSFIIYQKENDDWTAGSRFFHAGWRQRPDNLYAMGPLDNLVGMQYRIDHLENLKADVFDMIAFPVQKVKGYVQDYDYEPGARIYVGEDGDVEFMHPDTTALNADMQIQQLEQRMEEMAGAPREAMGIRSPGEKTKFEVQTLDNASSRMFLNKIRHFEVVFFEPLLNYGLQIARKNMSGTDVTRTLDSEMDAVIFSTITKDDIVANGVLHPEGASHFAYRANLLQNMVTLLNSAVMQDQAVKVHLSGKKIAKLAEELADLDCYKIYSDNARVFEQLETQKLMTQGTEQAQASASTPPGVLPHDTSTQPTEPAPLEPPPGIAATGKPQATAPQGY
jgi:hypothetical protein